MKFERRIALASVVAATIAAAACSSTSPDNHGAGTSTGSSSASNASASSGPGSGTSASGGGSSPGGTSGGTSTASASTSTGTSSGSAGASGSSGDVGATGVPCGGSVCYAPNSCCQSTDGSTSCVVSCTAQQQQLCVNDNDCQASGTATCVGGICTDSSVSDAGVSDVYIPPLEGGVYTPGDGGGVPTGYPPPTAASRALCQTTTMLVNGLCPGGGAGPVCIECLFGGTVYNNTLTPAPEATAAAGNYVVTVQLGGASAGQTSISAESSRGLLAPVMTKAGTSVEYAFVVNVRAMEGQPNHAGGPGGYPGLDLFFSGPTATPPQISAIGYALAAAATKPITVYMASDSTTCDQTGNVYGGWGQMLPEYFAPPVSIANYANSGASSGSFGPYWAEIKAKWAAGDWVIIQFGHNDKNVSDAVVQANLENYVSQALAANVTPIVVSPPARVQFSGSVESDQSSLHAAAAKAAAAAKNVAYVDLTTLSIAWYNSLGSQSAAMKFHANGTDATHTNLAGAEKLAGLVASAMKNQNIPLAKYLR